MQELYKRLNEYRRKKNVPWETIAIDYALLWVLTAISKQQLFLGRLLPELPDFNQAILTLKRHAYEIL